MDAERPNKERKTASAEDMNWEDYQSHETINEWVDSLQAEFPSLITVQEIGRSYEGRPIKLVKLSHNEVLELKIKSQSHSYQLFGNFIATEQQSDFYRSQYSRSRMDCFSNFYLGSQSIAAF